MKSKKSLLNSGYFSYKRRRFLFFFFKNIYKFKKLFNYFFFLNIFKYNKNNVFMNFSSFLNGNIIYKASSGHFLKKKSLRKSFYGTDFFFKSFKIPFNFINKKYFFFLNIRAFFFIRGFKKLLKNYVKTNLLLNKIKVKKINKILTKAHNGIRKKKKKRK